MQNHHHGENNNGGANAAAPMRSVDGPLTSMSTEADDAGRAVVSSTTNNQAKHGTTPPAATPIPIQQHQKDQEDDPSSAPFDPTLVVRAMYPRRWRGYGFFSDSAVEEGFVNFAFSGSSQLYPAAIAFVFGIVCATVNGGFLSPNYGRTPALQWAFHGTSFTAVAGLFLSVALFVCRLLNKFGQPKQIESQYLLVFALWCFFQGFHRVLRQHDGYKIRRGPDGWPFGFDTNSWGPMVFFVIIASRVVYSIPVLFLLGWLWQMLIMAIYRRPPNLDDALSFAIFAGGSWLQWGAEEVHRTAYLLNRNAIDLSQRVAMARNTVNNLMSQRLPATLLAQMIFEQNLHYRGAALTMKNHACVVSIFVESGLSHFQEPPAASQQPVTFAILSAKAAGKSDTVKRSSSSERWKKTDELASFVVSPRLRIIHELLSATSALIDDELAGLGGLRIVSTHGPEHFAVVFGVPDGSRMVETRACTFAHRFITQVRNGRLTTADSSSETLEMDGGVSPSSIPLESVRIAIHAAPDTEGCVLTDQHLAYQASGIAYDVAVSLSQRQSAAGSVIITAQVRDAVAGIRGTIVSKTTIADSPVLFRPVTRNSAGTSKGGEEKQQQSFSAQKDMISLELYELAACDYVPQTLDRRADGSPAAATGGDGGIAMPLGLGENPIRGPSTAPSRTESKGHDNDEIDGGGNRPSDGRSSSCRRTRYSRATEQTKERINERKRWLLRRATQALAARGSDGSSVFSWAVGDPADGAGGGGAGAIGGGDEVNLQAFRTRLLESRSCWSVVTFPDDIEVGYQRDKSIAFNRSVGPQMWLSLVPWIAVCIIKIGVDQVRSAAPYILLVIALIAALLLGTLRPFFHLTKRGGWIKRPYRAAILDTACVFLFYLIVLTAFFLLLPFSELANGNSDATIPYAVLFVFMCIRGSFGQKWWQLWIVNVLVFCVPYVIGIILTRRQLVVSSLLFLAVYPILGLICFRRLDEASRSAYVDVLVGRKAVSEAREEQVNVCAILLRSVPVFLIDPVVRWMPHRHEEPFCRSIPRVALLYIVIDRQRVSIDDQSINYTSDAHAVVTHAVAELVPNHRAAVVHAVGVSHFVIAFSEGICNDRARTHTYRLMRNQLLLQQQQHQGGGDASTAEDEFFNNRDGGEAIAEGGNDDSGQDTNTDLTMMLTLTDGDDPSASASKRKKRNATTEDSSSAVADGGGPPLGGAAGHARLPGGVVSDDVSTAAATTSAQVSATTTTTAGMTDAMVSQSAFSDISDALLLACKLRGSLGLLTRSPVVFCVGYSEAPVLFTVVGSNLDCYPVSAVTEETRSICEHAPPGIWIAPSAVPFMGSAAVRAIPLTPTAAHRGQMQEQQQHHGHEQSPSSSSYVSMCERPEVCSRRLPMNDTMQQHGTQRTLRFVEAFIEVDVDNNAPVEQGAHLPAAPRSPSADDPSQWTL